MKILFILLVNVLDLKLISFRHIISNSPLEISVQNNNFWRILFNIQLLQLPQQDIKLFQFPNAEELILLTSNDGNNLFLQFQSQNFQLQLDFYLDMFDSISQEIRNKNWTSIILEYYYIENTQNELKVYQYYGQTISSESFQILNGDFCNGNIIIPISNSPVVIFENLSFIILPGIQTIIEQDFMNIDQLLCLYSFRFYNPKQTKIFFNLANKIYHQNIKLENLSYSLKYQTQLDNFNIYSVKINFPQINYGLGNFSIIISSTFYMQIGNFSSFQTDYSINLYERTFFISSKVKKYQCEIVWQSGSSLNQISINYFYNLIQEFNDVNNFTGQNINYKFHWILQISSKTQGITNMKFYLSMIDSLNNTFNSQQDIQYSEQISYKDTHFSNFQPNNISVFGLFITIQEIVILKGVIQTDDINDFTTNQNQVTIGFEERVIIRNFTNKILRFNPNNINKLRNNIISDRIFNDDDFQDDCSFFENCKLCDYNKCFLCKENYLFDETSKLCIQCIFSNLVSNNNCTSNNLTFYQKNNTYNWPICNDLYCLLRIKLYDRFHNTILKELNLKYKDTNTPVMTLIQNQISGNYALFEQFQPIILNDAIFDINNESDCNNFSLFNRLTLTIECLNQCPDYYLAQNNKCIKQINGCSQLNNDYCVQCDSQFQEYDQNGNKICFGKYFQETIIPTKTLEISLLVPDCLIFEQIECISCKKTHKFKNFSCVQKSCNEYFEKCLSCDINDQCNSCEQLYFLDFNKRCSTHNSQNFFLNELNYQIVSGCPFCSYGPQCQLDQLYSNNTCYLKPIPYCIDIDLSNNCNKCQTGYFLTIYNSITQCLFMSKFQEGCLEYDINYKCILCDTNYVLWTQNTNQKCVSNQYCLDSPCTTCQQFFTFQTFNSQGVCIIDNCLIPNSSGYCDQCNQGSLLKSQCKCQIVDEDECLQCITGYDLYLTNCYLQILQCNAYNSDQTCSSCNEYYNLSNNECIIQNCLNYDINKQCTLCDNGYFVFDFFCVNIQNCIQFDVSLNCLQCGQYYNLVNQVCEISIANCVSVDQNGCNQCDINYSLQNNICYTTIQQCQTYDVITLLCSVCNINYTLQNGICYQTIQNCQNYDINTQLCTQCSQNYILQVGLCYQEVINCINYDQNTFECAQCQIDYILQNNQCNSPIQNCLNYNFSTQLCEICENNYTLIQNQCVIQIQNCDIYQNSLCQSCLQGYIQVNNTCVIEIQYCIQQIGNQCVECQYPKEFIQGQCIEQYGCLTSQCGSCAQNQIFIEEYQICVDFVQQCEIYNQNYRCQKCDDGYYLYQNDCIYINTLIENCIKMNYDMTICLQCRHGYYLDFNKCYECNQMSIDKQCLQKDQFLDITCFDLEKNCKQCNKFYQIECVLCIQRFYLLENFCIPCIQNCLICKNGKSCEVCEQGYQLQNNICEKFNILFNNNYISEYNNFLDQNCAQNKLICFEKSHFINDNCKKCKKICECNYDQNYLTINCPQIYFQTDQLKNSNKFIIIFGNKNTINFEMIQDLPYTYIFEKNIINYSHDCIPDFKKLFLINNKQLALSDKAEKNIKISKKVILNSILASMFVQNLLFNIFVGFLKKRAIFETMETIKFNFGWLFNKLSSNDQELNLFNISQHSKKNEYQYLLKEKNYIFEFISLQELIIFATVPLNFLIYLIEHRKSKMKNKQKLIHMLYLLSWTTIQYYFIEFIPTFIIFLSFYHLLQTHIKIIFLLKYYIIMIICLYSFLKFFKYVKKQKYSKYSPFAVIKKNQFSYYDSLLNKFIIIDYIFFYVQSNIVFAFFNSLVIMLVLFFVNILILIYFLIKMIKVDRMAKKLVIFYIVDYTLFTLFLLVSIIRYFKIKTYNFENIIYGLSVLSSLITGIAVHCILLQFFKSKPLSYNQQSKVGTMKVRDKKIKFTFNLNLEKLNKMKRQTEELKQQTIISMSKQKPQFFKKYVKTLVHLQQLIKSRILLFLYNYIEYRVFQT